MVKLKRRYSFCLFIALLALLVAACGNGPESRSGSGKAGAAAAASYTNTVEVTIENFKFEPAEITVEPGTRVVFINKDPTPHNVVAGTAKQVADKNHKPAFASPELGTNERWEYVFDTEGEFPYACTIAGHYLLGMVGTVTVVEGAEPATQAVAPGSEADHSEHMHAPVIPAVALEHPDKYNVTPEGLVELLPFKVDGNVKEFAMDIQEVTHEIVEGVPVTAWAFNGVVPGPVLRVTEGDVVRVHFTNTHHQPHTIHWHGIYADQEHDGVPHTSAAVMPGETRVYEFVAADAGTFWYHCHVDSYRHVDMGMYGGLIVDPKDGKTWDREYTIILDDWDSNIDAMALKYRPDHNYFIVNGKAFPEMPSITLPVGEVTRVRFINAGYNNFAMHLHGPRFLVVDTDGRPLPLPYEKDTLDIAPGERYDIEIRPTKAGDYPFHAHNLQFNLNDGVYPGGMHFMVNIVDLEQSE